MLTSKSTVLLQFSLCLLLFKSYGTCTEDRNQTYQVNSSTDLELYLCNTTWSSQYLVFLLNSSVKFTISPGNFCQMNSQATSTSIKICSDSPTQSAIISCTYENNTELHRRGLIFFNTSITLERLVFKNCGTYLTTIQDLVISDYLNSSSVYYTSSHAAALVFVHCQVNISQVNFHSSYGFAMIGVDLYNSTIDSVSMSNSSHSVVEVCQHNHSIGSGLILHYIDINNSIAIYDIIIRNANFSNNSDYNNYNTCLTDTYTSSRTYKPIVNAAGVTIVYTQQSHNQVSVSVTESYFHNNTGSFAGGMFVLQYNTIAVTNTSIINSLFHNNMNIKPCRGGSMVFYYSLSSETQKNKSLVYIINTSFSNNHIFQRPKNSHDQNYGAIYIVVLNPTFHLHINLINCNFTNNYAAVRGTCLFARVLQFSDNCIRGNVSFTLDSTIATNNSQNRGVPIVSFTGMFYFDRISRIDITGTSHFSNNYGSVISSTDSNVYLSGNLTFNDNYALTGAAIRLVGTGQLYFMSGVIAKFTDNSAESLGGAIYAEGAERNNECVVQIDSNVSKVLFSNNEAKRAGNSIYAEPIFFCSINKSNYGAKNLEFYNQHFTFVNMTKSNNNYDISSNSRQALDGSNVLQYTQQIYSGQELFYCIRTIDALSRSAYSATAIYIVRNNSQPNIPKTTKLWLSFNDQEQLIQEGKNCTTISVTVHTNDKINTIDGIIIFSQPTSLTKTVKIYPCPLGFDLNKTIGICQLSSSFDNLRKHQLLTALLLVMSVVRQ